MREIGREERRGTERTKKRQVQSKKMEERGRGGERGGKKQGRAKRREEKN